MLSFTASFPFRKVKLRLEPCNGCKAQACLCQAGVHKLLLSTPPLGEVVSDSLPGRRARASAKRKVVKLLKFSRPKQALKLGKLSAKGCGSQA